jgi:hypothetical protein
MFTQCSCSIFVLGLTSPESSGVRIAGEIDAPARLPHLRPEEAAMRRWLIIGGLALAGIAAVALAIVYVLWDTDWRWRPHTVDKDQDAIAQALDASGWVSPHLTGPKLYVVMYRDCGACVAFANAELPKLQALDVDTRFVVVARAAQNGQQLSTPAERATVAELWVGRSWKLFQQWTMTPADAWTAPGLAPADGDAARTAVVAAGQQTVAALTRSLDRNGVAFDYPLLVWWTRDGRMRTCACTDARMWPYVDKELAP